MFNEVWYRRAPVRRRDELQTIPTFFHPLDMIGGWNRIYGPQGFIQWQFVVPLEAEDELREIVSLLGSARCTSFLAVLKRFGAGNPGPLSFPMEGWTLALDIPTGVKGLGPLLDRLDDVVIEAGGRVYLAKDNGRVLNGSPRWIPASTSGGPFANGSTPTDGSGATWPTPRPLVP